MTLEEIRNQIDKIDDQILALLGERIIFVEKVGELKKNKGTKGVYIRPEREDKMMQRLLKKGAGRFPSPAIFAIWRAIISGSLMIENPFKIITTNAANKDVYEYFGAFNNYYVLGSEDDVFANITSQDVGVLPDGANWQKMPKDMQVFAQIKGFKAFAKVDGENA